MIEKCFLCGGAVEVPAGLSKISWVFTKDGNGRYSVANGDGAEFHRCSVPLTPEHARLEQRRLVRVEARRAARRRVRAVAVAVATA